MATLDAQRLDIRSLHTADDAAVVARLRETAEVSQGIRDRATSRAIKLVEDIRTGGDLGLMEVFLAEYGLSTDEGIALMCLAEALLRVPDAATMDELIDDKITPSHWNEHLGKSSSSLVNASTWALMLTGKVLNEDGQGVVASLKGAVKRLGEPVIRTAVQQAMKELGRQFVLGETIKDAIDRGAKQQKQGYTFSYDMLGEAALTSDDAARNFKAYATSIKSLAPHCTASDIRANPGISIKLSAIHPRYEFSQSDRVMSELVPNTLKLAQLAKAAGMGLNIDAEEAMRLDLSLDVIQSVLSDDSLAGWHGFGVVVQAYGKRAAPVIDWLYALAGRLNRRIMVRLVKGAYWDTEIKRAQVEGLDGFPVFTRKQATDVSYICCAKMLLARTDRIYPQFATHNAHTVATILELAQGRDVFEFQRLHGMGGALYDRVKRSEKARCRIYAPVGTHRDLLAYLVRRLLENGANSSFVNQIVSKTVPAAEICADPFAALDRIGSVANTAIATPQMLFGKRRNSRGWDLSDADTIAALNAARAPFKDAQWNVAPIIAGHAIGDEIHQIANPANPDDLVGSVTLADHEDAETAIAAAEPWATPANNRAAILRTASELYEENFGEIFAILCREAGKTPDDAIAELREAVDFLRYYADEAERLSGAIPLGTVSCISPWNFPLAIFTGQIAAALAAGNAVLAKPAEPTPIIADLAVKLMHRAGVPATALQLLPGLGATIGAAITASPAIDGVCFTGSTATAQTINRAMAKNLSPSAPLIAETGGINAMLVDSTALPEQAVKDIVMSAFKSAGQRCSALRVLYVQEDVADGFMKMLAGAMDELNVADPWEFSTDLGPIINADARQTIDEHIKNADKDDKLLKQITAPDTGTFIAPSVVQVKGIQSIKSEIFGPVMHLATFAAADINVIINHINSSGYGLTFGMHSRIDDRIAQVTDRLHAGNIYINRNQIGAIVGSQPFGGEGMSGTGPKAGGPAYVDRFAKSKVHHPKPANGALADLGKVQAAIDAAEVPMIRLSDRSMSGPTGESNQLSTYGRGIILCLGADAQDAEQQAKIVRDNGCAAVIVAPGAKGDAAVSGRLDSAALTSLTGFHGAVLWSDEDAQRSARVALAARQGPILPLITERHFADRCRVERHICIDTTAAGGNASLLAAVS